MNQSNNNRKTDDSIHPYAKLATWLQLCISKKEYQTTINIKCNKCKLNHDLPLDLYSRPYQVLTDYTALTSPFAHIGDEIKGNVVIISKLNEPNTIVFWFDEFKDDDKTETNRKQLNSANIKWVEVDTDDIDLDRENNIGVIWKEPFLRLVAYQQSKHFDDTTRSLCENNSI